MWHIMLASKDLSFPLWNARMLKTPGLLWSMRLQSLILSLYASEYQTEDTYLLTQSLPQNLSFLRLDMMPSCLFSVVCSSAPN